MSLPICATRLGNTALLMRRSGNLLSSCWQRGVALRPPFSDLLATLKALREKVDAGPGGAPAAAESVPDEPPASDDVYTLAVLPDIQVTAEPT